MITPHARGVTHHTDPFALSPGTLLDVQEVAAILRVSVHTLKNWRRDRSGPRWIAYGKQRLYRAGDLVLWLEKRVAREASGED